MRDRVPSIQFDDGTGFRQAGCCPVATPTVAARPRGQIEIIHGRDNRGWGESGREAGILGREEKWIRCGACQCATPTGECPARCRRGFQFQALSFHTAGWQGQENRRVIAASHGPATDDAHADIDHLNQLDAVIDGVARSHIDQLQVRATRGSICRLAVPEDPVRDLERRCCPNLIAGSQSGFVDRERLQAVTRGIIFNQKLPGGIVAVSHINLHSLANRRQKIVIDVEIHRVLPGRSIGAPGKAVVGVRRGRQRPTDTPERFACIIGVKLGDEAVVVAGMYFPASIIKSDHAGRVASLCHRSHGGSVKIVHLCALSGIGPTNGRISGGITP